MRPLALGLLVLLSAGAAHAGLEVRPKQQPAAPSESGLQRVPKEQAPLRPPSDDTQRPSADDTNVAASGKFQVPPIQGHVTDEAGVLEPAERARLEARLAQLRRESGYEVAIFVPASLQGHTVEDVAYDTFQAWKLGQAEPDNGVLLVVAPKERRLRIETGKGVGGELTDLQSSRIIRDAITPRLRQGDWAGALTAGADGIARALTGRPLPGVPGQPEGPSDGVGGSGPEVVGPSPFTCILFSIFALFMLSRFFGGPRGGRRRRGGIIFVPPIFGGGWRGGGFGGGRDRGGGGGGGFGGGGGGESGGGGASGRW